MTQILSLVLFLVFSVSSIAQKKEAWVPLFNGKDLSGWDVYLDHEIDSIGTRLSSSRLGLNNDPFNVFSVVMEEGRPAIRISGKIWGGLSTQKEFSDYHLQLEFKWGNTPSWGPKRGKKKDSGVLYHGSGEHGTNAEPWLRSQEFQVEEGNTGDYWGVAGAGEEIKTIKAGDKNYIYDPTGTTTTFCQSSAAGRHCKKMGDAELPLGEWNTLDLYCFNGMSVHIVNDKVVMILLNSFQEDNGIKKPLSSGRIQLQSEGAELFYRNIRIKPIKEIPAEMLK